MKKFVGIFLFLLIVNLMVPLLYYKVYYAATAAISPQNTPTPVVSPTAQANNDVITLYNLSSKTTEEIALIDYLIGAAACEVPPYFEAEAIKAQMIAIHSYYQYVQANPDFLEDQYITFDETLMQGYASKFRLQEYWQMNFNDYYQKYLRCANEVANMVLEYKNTPALTPYFAVSCGKTQSSQDEWDTALPYLVSVDSPNDAVSDDYLKMRSLTTQELHDRLTTSFTGLDLDTENPEQWFGDIIYNQAGYATLVNVGGSQIPGDQFRDFMQLPSSCFMIFYEEGSFSIATKGVGHGVGLSQFGANELSKSGKKYNEILSYYYPGTILKNI